MHFRQVSLCATRPLSLRKKASSCFLFLLILGTDIPPFCHPAHAGYRTAKYGRVSVSFLNNLSGLPPESGRMRIVRSPFQSLSSHEFSFHFSCYAVTPQMGEPTIMPGSSFWAASHFPVNANIC